MRKVMSQEPEFTSRRNFARAAGALAVSAIGGAAVAQPRMQQGRRMAMQGGRQADLARLSNSLFNSPQARAQFLANPQGYASRLGLNNVGRADVAQVRNLIADGFCCNGCGCSGRFGDTVTNPQATP
jgi:hypothetical protein